MRSVKFAGALIFAIRLALPPHLHVLISYGGLNASNQWLAPKKGKLFPKKPVMLVFRGKFRSLVRKHLDADDLVYTGG